MNLRELAASELAALSRSASDPARKAVRGVHDARRAFEAALDALEKAVSTLPASDEAIGALAAKLAEASAKEIEAATTRARAESQKALDEAVAGVRKDADRARDEAVATARKDADRARDEAVERTRAEVTALLRAEEQASAALRQQVKEATAATALADAVRREAEAARDKETLLRTGAEREARAMRERAETAEREATRARGETAAAREALAAAKQGADATQAAAEAAAAVGKRRIEQLEQALVAAESAHAEQVRMLRAQIGKVAVQPLEHLRAAFHRLSEAGTIDQVLSILLDALAAEFSRVAIFDVAANRLEGRHQVGFDAEGGVSKILIPLSVDSPLANAVRAGRVQGLPARELADQARVPFGGAPTFVLALPVVVRGRAIAVLYADDSDQPDAELILPERRIKFAEALFWYAIPLLTRVAAEDEAMAELREYAASVVRDLESVYVADAASRTAAELKVRLRHNLEYARRRFAERIEAQPAAGSRLLDQELEKIAAAKRETPFGRDLATVAGIRLPAPPKASIGESNVASSQRA